MPNIDLMSILPLLSGGKNPDVAQILAAMGKAPPSAPAAPPPSPMPPPRSGGNNFADYSKLYPHTPINNLPRADQTPSQQRPSMQNSGPFGGDMSNILQLVAAMNSARGQNGNNNNGSQQPAQPPPVAPTAPREIQDSLRAILTLNELRGDTNKRG